MTKSGSHKDHGPDAEYSNLELTVAEDRMSAELKLEYNPQRGFHYHDAMRLLEAHKIVFGINHDAIYKLESEYKHNEQKGREWQISVAKGYPVTLPEDGHVDILIKPPPKVVIDEDGRADFRNIQRFQTVDNGDVLAREFDAIPGKAGLDIFGKEVLPPEPSTDLIQVGKNIVRLNRTSGAYQDYAAGVHGIFVHKGHFIDVNPELLIPGNVGLESGNVDYDGNVKVGRNIERGTTVKCMGDMKVGGMIESGDVHVGGSLQVVEGINGGREKMLHSNGDLRAHYIDNSRVFVDGSIEVQRSINSSAIMCMGDLMVVDSHGNICGGEVAVYGSLSVASIGNRAETPTHIVLGNHIKNIELLKRFRHDRQVLEDKYNLIQEEVAAIQSYITRARGKVAPEKRIEFRKTMTEYRQHKAALEKCIARIQNLKQKQYNKDPIRLIAREQIYPGVIIHYRHHVEKVLAPMTRCVLKFSPKVDGPIISAWKPGMES